MQYVEMPLYFLMFPGPLSTGIRKVYTRCWSERLSTLQYLNLICHQQYLAVSI